MIFRNRNSSLFSALSIFILLSLGCREVRGQFVGIGTNDPRQMLHVAGGLRLDTLVNSTGGLMFHNKWGIVFSIPFNNDENFFYTGAGTLKAINTIGWRLDGNSGTNPSSHFLGTTDAVPLQIKVNNSKSGLIDPVLKNTYWGYFSGASASGQQNTGSGAHSLQTNTGSFNTAMGSLASYSNKGNNNSAYGYNSQFFNDTGSNNTSSGANSLTQNVSGSYNSAFGYLALQAAQGGSNVGLGAQTLAVTTGSFNTAVGTEALNKQQNVWYSSAFGYRALYNNTVGVNNAAFGGFALSSNQGGLFNSAFGTYAMEKNASGNYNSAMGTFALRGENAQNNSGNKNAALGYNALYANYADDNTAVGFESMKTNSSGFSNSAFGVKALFSNTSGYYNCAFGMISLYSNQDGNGNSAFGYQSLNSNLSGSFNAAIGNSSMYNNLSGSQNCALGWSSLLNNSTGYSNTAIGLQALSRNETGYGNTAIGAGANVLTGATNLHNATVIGYNAEVDADDKIVLGNTSVNSIGGWAAFTTFSDRRLKENIQYTDKLGLNFISRLRPATYAYTSDPNKRTHNGLIAQDVEEILTSLNLSFSGLVIDKNEKQTLNLAYAEFVIPLITAVQEQQKQIEELKKLVQELQEKVK